MGALPHLSPETTDELVDGLHQALNEAKVILETHDEFSHSTLENLMRSFHLTKGFAQPLGLHGVATAAHELEGRLIRLMAHDSPARFSNVELKALVSEGLQKIQSVLGRFHEMQIRAMGERQALRPGLSSGPDFRSLFERTQAVAHSLAHELGLRLEFVTQGGELPLRERWVASLDAVLLNLVRNSLDHGAKPGNVMVLSLHAREEREELVLEFTDNGLGIDASLVREVARSRGLRFGAELDRMSDGDVLQLLFSPAFSTRSQTSLLSGRGFGLHIVREAAETRLGGSIRIDSRVGHGVRVVLRFRT